MGLDMFAWSVAPHNAISPTKIENGCDRIELKYWRKHHDLHGWMEKLYYAKGGTANSFNCEVVELTEEDLNNLATAIEQGHLPPTTGFFFGNNPPPDEDSNNEDMEFIQAAREAIDNGCKVYYDSWW
jgi:hypothetical protein